MGEGRRAVRAMPLIAVVSACLALAGIYGAWDWGRREGYWGTSDELARLSSQEVIAPDEGLASRVVDRSPHRALLGKPRPQWVEVEIAPSPGSGAPATADGLSHQLRAKATRAGWAIDEECMPDLLWCARRIDAEGLTLFMTVSASQGAEPKSSERMSGEADRADTESGVLRVRMQYL